MDLKIETLPVGILETNCYIVMSGTDTAVIDPGDDVERIVTELKSIPHLNLRYILVTHGHFDHILALDALSSAFQKAQVLAGDIEMIKNLNLQEGHYGVAFPKIRAKITPVRDGLKIPFGNTYYEVIETPGHTSNGVSYLINDFLFSGDTLFYHATGRVDLPGSNAQAMKESLKKLGKLDRNIKVYSGHGQPTTIGMEKDIDLL